MTVMMKRQMSLGPKQNDQEIENVEGRARASESERERERRLGEMERMERIWWRRSCGKMWAAIYESLGNHRVEPHKRKERPRESHPAYIDLHSSPS